MTSTTSLSSALVSSMKQPTLYITLHNKTRMEILFYRAFIRSFEAYDIDTNELKYKHV